MTTDFVDPQTPASPSNRSRRALIRDSARLAAPETAGVILAAMGKKIL
jgi:hypothetical protein